MAAPATDQFQPGHRIPVHHQDKPGFQYKMPHPKPIDDLLPTDDGGFQPYKAAGKLKGRRAIITGGDSGIGRAIAILYAMEGASSLIVYLPEEEQDAQATKRDVEKHGVKCHLLATDLRKKENCRKVVETALKEMGGIDILINNAAFQHMLQDISQLSEEQWEHTFDTNIHPFFYLSKYCLEHMKRGATIINCSSVNHYIGRPDLLDYTSTKGAIVAYTRALAVELAWRGIRVNAIAPGWVTVDNYYECLPGFNERDARKTAYEKVPLARYGLPEDIAKIAVFLCSDDAGYIVGQTIVADGGTTSLMSLLSDFRSESAARFGEKYL